MCRLETAFSGERLLPYLFVILSYQAKLSSPPASGSRSRDNTFLSVYTDSSSSSVPRARSGAWCTCPEDSSMLLPSNGGQCLECRMTASDHDGWCLSRGRVCHRCRRPVIASRDGHSLDKETARELTDDVLTITKLRENSLILKSPSSSDYSAQPIPEKTAVLETDVAYRVHFAETVQEKTISRNSCSERSPCILSKDTKNNENFSEHDADQPRREEMYPHGTDEDLDLGRKKFQVKHINPDIHRDAYVRAVKDAHARLKSHSKKKGKKRKRQNVQGTAPCGIIFSYFPLLKRPFTETNLDQVKDLGLRQDNGKKLRLKDAMKHILGSAKLGDYYPGGKRYFTQY
ncbi:hypothetical protein ElyMa_004338600 [Elysia marginata]|uniref:Uncharacterized protein n=1 Tax=Elysia marginata TaxID=1093978 RepID=A0AAV4H5F4_9GAST|nr:hypothetical protein ElyMa_004338600 [Elysia marginata]